MSGPRRLRGTSSANLQVCRDHGKAKALHYTGRKTLAVPENASTSVQSGFSRIYGAILIANRSLVSATRWIRV
jgi:hypothetical protein